MDAAAVLAQVWPFAGPSPATLRLLALFLAWAVASFAVVRVFHRLVVARARATATPWDDLLAQAAQWPLYAGLLAAGTWVLTSLPEAAGAAWTEPARALAGVVLAVALAHGVIVFARGMLERRAARDTKVAAVQGALALAVRLVVWSVVLMTVLIPLGITITRSSARSASEAWRWPWPSRTPCPNSSRGSRCASTGPSGRVTTWTSTPVRCAAGCWR